MIDKSSATKHKQAFENCKLFYSITDEQIEKYYKNLETPENNQDYDVLKVAMSSDGVIVSSPTKYTNRVQDKYATSLTDAEIDVLLPLNRFQ